MDANEKYCKLSYKVKSSTFDGNRKHGEHDDGDGDSDGDSDGDDGALPLNFLLR